MMAATAPAASMTKPIEDNNISADSRAASRPASVLVTRYNITRHNDADSALTDRALHSFLPNAANDAVSPEE